MTGHDGAESHGQHERNLPPICKMGNLQIIEFSEISNGNKLKLKKELVGIILKTSN